MVVDTLWRDLRHAWRGLWTSRLFAASIAANMGLGLGILGSAFALVNAYLLTPIGLPEPHALYSLSWDTAAASNHRFSLADYDALHEQNPVFAGVAAGDAVRALHGDVTMAGQAVTGNYFRVLGSRAVLGRTLLPEDAVAPGGRAVVVLSHDTWRARFAADPAIVGRDILLGRQPFQVVGVIEPGVALPGEETLAFWVPLTMARAFTIVDPWRSEAASLFAIGRLRSDATRELARAWLGTWLRTRAADRTATAAIVPRVESVATRIPLNGATLTLFSLILAAFGMVLLVACANVANMLLARGLARQRELAIRLSLGASRGRLVRQLVIECLVLGVPAALVGLAITFAAARAFPFLVLATLPAGAPPAAPFLASADPDLRVLAFLALAALAAAALVGLVSALRLTRRVRALGVTGTVGEDASGSRLRRVLVGVQIGAAAAFLVGASGLIAESRRMTRADTGLAYAHVLGVRLPAAVRAKVAERLAIESSVERVAIARHPPLAGPLRTVRVVASNARAGHDAGTLDVSADYFALFGIGLVRGRTFTPAEVDTGAGVAIVSEATARLFWPGQDPIGQTLRVRRPAETPDGAAPPIEVRVTGVVRDVVSGSIIDGVDRTCIYLPAGMATPGVDLLVRARRDLPAARRAVAAAIAAEQPGADIQIHGIRDMLALQMWAFSAFSAAAALLGLVGLVLAFGGTYAVVAFLVEQRTRELGVRMALGATVQRLVAGLVAEMLRVAGIAAAAGVAAAAGLAHAAGATLDMMPTFGSEPYLVGSAVVLAASALAALWPALRTARIDPSDALRGT